MGKKGKRSGFGGSGGGGNARGGGSGSARPPPGLVVVNPMLLQSMAGKSASAKAAPAKGPKAKPKTKQQPPSAKKNKKQQPTQTPNKKRKQRGSESEEDRDDDGDDVDEPASKKAHHHDTTKPKQKPSRGDVDTDGAVAPLFQLQLAREDQGLAGLYWVLLTRESKRSAVVALPNAHATLTPPLVAHALKSLGFQALSLHSKMTPGQRKQNVERLVEQSRAGNDKCVLVANDHWLGSAACDSADLVALGASFVGKSTVETKFARVFVVHADATVPARAESFEKPLSSNQAALQQIQARLKIATQIATTLQRLQSGKGGDGGDGAETKWATKFAKGADLSDDDDDDAKSKKKNKGPLNPDEQRLRALTEKLLVLLGRNLSVDASTGAPAGNSTSNDDAQHRAEKLKALGVVVLSAAVGASAGDGERLSAQTQWLDRAPGARFGAEWTGVVRHGASKDAASLAVRRHVCECIGGKKPTKTTATTTHLRAWRPNQQPADTDAWGGAYGKACGHNEVAMQHLRPFFPQEVLNSRVCSKRQPAPGNQGFDGCLEFLRLACLDAQRGMTVWDSEQFVFLSKSGRVSCVSKLQFLSLPLAGLQTLMLNMRQWTLACEGRKSPVLLLEGIRLCCRLGAEDVTSSRLPDTKLVRRVLAFAVGGSQRVWKQIAKMPTPIASEVVYDAA